MKKLALALLVLSAGCVHAAPTPGPTDPLVKIHADAKNVANALNAASTISVTALGIARTIPNLLPATVAKIADGVRTFNCALLDDGDAAPMPPPATGTVSDSCHAHNDKMLGILSKLQAVGSADTLKALALQGLTYANQAIDAIDASGSANLANFVAVAKASLAIVSSIVAGGA